MTLKPLLGAAFLLAAAAMHAVLILLGMTYGLILAVIVTGLTAW